MKKLSLLIKILTLIVFITIIVKYSLYVYAFITPKFIINENDKIIFYDKNNENMFSNNSDNYTKIDNINENVINAIISAEDKNFYEHDGFDYLRIIKAIITNVVSGEIKQGASTISQQYIKNLYLTFDKTWERKIEEALLTIELETHYNKNEILEGYLNTINFGAGNYGIKNASNYYYNKEPKDLSLAEATILVGIPKNPTYYNPITNYTNAKKRQKEILNLMYKNKYINKDDINNIYNENINFYGENINKNNSTIYYYKDAVLNELNSINRIPKTLLDTNGIIIYTNFDRNAQNTLENNINNEMKNTTMQVASVIIEPKTGKIIALAGGKNYNTSQYNRAVSSKRQVGSTIKPFLYYAALENSFTPSSTFLSERTTFNINDITYSPRNANNVYANKNISMLAAITYSDNIYAMKTHLYLGTDILSKTINRAKIKTEVKENASSSLGTTEINIIDYSNGFITLANEGKHESPHLIEKITDLNGNVIYQYKYENEYILNKKYVYILNNMMSNTYNYKMINYTSPTMISISSLLDGKYAIKSGSTDTDYWTIGYNNDILMMIWAGNDDNSKTKASESKITKKIWAKTISNIESNNNTWYEIPNGIVASIIDPISGEANNNGIVCYYEKGTEPNYKIDEFYNNFLQ